MPPDIRGRHTSPASANESNSNTICSAKVIRWFTTRQHSGPTSRWEYPQGDGYASLALPVTNRAARLPVGCLIAAAPRRTFCKGAREEQ